MQKFSTWMIVCLAVIFWLLRVVATYMYAMGMEFFVVPLDNTLEIVLLFVALVCFVLIAKRKLLGVVLYAVSYIGYFGVDVYNNIQNISGTMSTDAMMSLLFSFFGTILPIVVLLDWLLDNTKKNHPKDKKTDWFYANEEYDRNLDDRSDKNNYRTL